MKPSTPGEIFSDLLPLFSGEFRGMIESNRSRILWQVEQLTKLAPVGSSVVDLGAGLVPFMPICQQLGYNTVIVDDYRDATYPRAPTEAVLERFQAMGVKVCRCDIFEDRSFLAELPELDVVSTQDSIEHWHHSPKSLFHELWAKLRKGGVLWIGAPNCVNLRKRLTVPLGVGKWSQMVDWYEQPTFRGHVREPDVGDLEYIARDLGAERTRISGKNWVGYRHPSALVRKVMPLVDRPLQLFPGLCSDIYLLAWK